MKISTWYDDWIATYKQRKVKPITIETYNSICKTHIKPAIGDVDLHRVTPAQVQVILNRLCDEGYSSQTISMTQIILNGMFRQAYKCGQIKRNPCEFIEIPQGKPKREITVFTRAQQDLFLRYCQQSPLRDLFYLALYTGMREGELFALRWIDVDLQRHRIYVRHTLRIAKGGGPVLRTPKSATSVRDIPLLPAAEELLLKRRTIAESEMDKDTDFVFTMDGQPIRKGYVTREIQSLLKQMECDGVAFPYFTLHTTRHSFATRCIEAGMKPKVLQQILGHSSLMITMDTYVTIMDDEKTAQMQLLNKFY